MEHFIGKFVGNQPFLVQTIFCFTMPILYSFIVPQDALCVFWQSPMIVKVRVSQKQLINNSFLAWKQFYKIDTNIVKLNFQPSPGFDRKVSARRKRNKNSLWRPNCVSRKWRAQWCGRKLSDRFHRCPQRERQRETIGNHNNGRRQGDATVKHIL